MRPLLKRQPKRPSLASFLPALLLGLFTLIIAFLNYEPGTILSGWDNLHPEFAPAINLQRTLFAVWQEYQSTGLLGGMAHAADLPHTLFIYLVSLLIDPKYYLYNIRYFVTFFLLFLGPLGVFYDLKHHFLRSSVSRLDQILHHQSFDDHTKFFASLMGALFYLLNLTTLQTFFTPYETFIFFYAFFPWLIYTSILYLSHPNKRHLLALTIITFLATPSFYVETLFVVYGLCLLPILFHSFSRKSPLATLSFLATTIFVNAFWLLPITFFVLTNSQVGLDAHINQIATPETYDRNLAFATIPNILLGKSFWFDFTDLGPNGKFDYLLSVWRNHQTNPAIIAISYFNVALIITGLLYALKKHLNFAAAILDIALICGFFLLGGGLLINSHLPLIAELFRSPFTKFSIPLFFSYSIFFSVGSIFILDLFSLLHHKLTYYLTFFSISLGLVIYMAPVFTGNLISPSMRVHQPSYYQDLFAFFSKQDPTTRIANFPQYTFWGWNYYSWGYRGSGLLWYGLRQPVLDRAFDVWEKESQNYYSQIDSAIYSGDQKAFIDTLRRYSATWVLIDKNVISPDNSQALYTNQILAMVDNSPSFELTKNFNDRLLVYRLKDVTAKNYLSTKPTLTSLPVLNLTSTPTTTTKITSDQITIPATIPNLPIKTLKIPSLTDSETLIPTQVSYRKNFDTLEIRLTPISPSLTLDDKTIILPTTPTVISQKVDNNLTGFILGIDNHFFEFQLPAEITYQKDFYPLATTYLPSKNFFNIDLYSNSFDTSENLMPFLIQNTPSQCYGNKPDRKIEKVVDNNAITLLGTDVVGCLSVPITTSGKLISLTIDYSSPTHTPAHVNITNQNFGSPTSEPTEPSNTDTHRLRLFSNYLSDSPQLNLILEASDTKSTQEITYSNVTLYSHTLLSTQTTSLTPVKGLTLPIADLHALSIIVPYTSSPYTIQMTPTANSLFPESQNCNNFSTGTVGKKVDSTGITYSAQNAIACDFATFPQLPHSLGYLLSITTQNLTHNSPLVCLENFVTKRCDFYERLPLSQQSKTYSIISPIANPAEAPGYTYHFYNSSFSNLETKNIVTALQITPLSLNFLKNLTFQTDLPTPTDISSSHPYEFLYQSKFTNSKSTNLFLLQTYSPYWIAFESATPKNFFVSSKYDWYNSWFITPGTHNLTIIYAPQALEFAGLGLLILIVPIVLLHKK